VTTISSILASESVRFSKVKLADPAPSEYVHIAAEVDERALFLPNSWRKRQLIGNCTLWCRRLATNLTLGEAPDTCRGPALPLAKGPMSQTLEPFRLLS
jgi:hypothetical protein